MEEGIPAGRCLRVLGACWAESLDFVHTEPLKGLDTRSPVGLLFTAGTVEKMLQRAEVAMRGQLRGCDWPVAGGRAGLWQRKWRKQVALEAESVELVLN